MLACKDFGSAALGAFYELLKRNSGKLFSRTTLGGPTALECLLAQSVRYRAAHHPPPGSPLSQPHPGSSQAGVTSEGVIRDDAPDTYVGLSLPR